MGYKSRKHDEPRRGYHVLPEGDIKVRKPVKERRDFASALMWFFMWLLFALIVVGFAILMFVNGINWGERNANRHMLGLNKPRIISPFGIITSEPIFVDWTRHIRKNHAIERKIGSVSLADSLIGDPSDHIFLGVFERDVLQRKREAAIHFYLATANGHPDGYRLYNSLNVPTEDYQALYQLFVAMHQMNGDLGLERLGQYYLGKDAFKIARRMRTRLRFEEPNDYIWPRQQEAENLAYIHFHMSASCGLTSAYDWRAETARYYQFTAERENSLRNRANAELRDLTRRYREGRGFSQDDYCKRQHLQGQYDRLKGLYNRMAVLGFEERLEGWTGGHPCDLAGHTFSDDACTEFDYYLDEEGVFALNIEVPTVREIMDALVDEGWFPAGVPPYLAGPFGAGPPGRGRIARAGASPAFRDAPGGQVEEGIRWQEGRFEHDCGAPGDPGYDDCIVAYREAAPDRRLDDAVCNDEANRFLNLGEAQMAVGRILNARRRLNQAIAAGRQCGSPYAVRAGKLLSALNLTCEYTPTSLSRISRGYYKNPEGGAIIDVESRQRALRAKGLYSGDVDGRYGPRMRDAVKGFQRELGFLETGDLTPIETVYLICSAAETHSDLKSINSLGIMYMAGLGVVQSTDRGLDWLRQAAERDNEDAMFNLALIYGTGTVVQSYRLCGNVENIDRADSWLEQAAFGGHPPAIRLVELYGELPPSERWTRIREELELNDFYVERLEPVGEACTPNP